MNKIIETFVILKIGNKVLKEFAKKIEEEKLKEKRFNQKDFRLMEKLRR